MLQRMKHIVKLFVLFIAESVLSSVLVAARALRFTADNKNVVNTHKSNIEIASSSNSSCLIRRFPSYLSNFLPAFKLSKLRIALNTRK